MGTNLQVQNLTLDDFGGPRFEGCNENLLITRPDAVENVHRAFLEVGCDVIETNSFNGTPGRLCRIRPSRTRRTT
jgi:5-methyltetrahydrofolate--homocysteine methyltransferase